MSVKPSNQCFGLVRVKILVHAQKLKLFFGSLTCKLLVDLKASKLTQLGHFLFYCPFKGGYFSSVDLEMVVRVRLREVKKVELL